MPRLGTIKHQVQHSLPHFPIYRQLQLSFECPVITYSFMEQQHHPLDTPPTPPPHRYLHRPATRREPTTDREAPNTTRRVHFALQEDYFDGHTVHQHQYMHNTSNLNTGYSQASATPPPIQVPSSPPPPYSPADEERPPTPPPHIPPIRPKPILWAHRKTAPKHFHTKWDFGVRVPGRPLGPKPEPFCSNSEAVYEARWQGEKMLREDTWASCIEGGNVETRYLRRARDTMWC
jgi:hypothetical protein